MVDDRHRYLCRGLKNPNGVARITLNYEKFLLDKDGVPVRRYPRKLEAEDFEQDVQVNTVEIEYGKYQVQRVTSVFFCSFLCFCRFRVQYNG